MVSIIIPLHNKACYLPDTLQSVIDQSYREWEVIIVENNSEDDGLTVAKTLAKNDSRISVIDASGQVSGPGAARNVGLDLAKGEWILFLDADDLIAENHLSSLLAKQNTQTSVSPDVIVSDWVEFKNSNANKQSISELLSTSSLHVERREPVGSRSKRKTTLSDSAIAFAPWAIHCAIIKSTPVRDQSIRWIEHLDAFPSEDTAFWFRVIWNKQIAYSLSSTALYRVEIADNRNAHDDLPRWYTATKMNIEENLLFLDRQGGKVTSKQAATLMRMWEQFSIRAMSAGENQISMQAAAKRNYWLNRSNPLDPAIAYRRLFARGLHKT